MKTKPVMMRMKPMMSLILKSVGQRLFKFQVNRSSFSYYKLNNKNVTKRFYCYFSILLGRVYPSIRECIVLQENLTMTSTDNVTPAEHHGTSNYLCDYTLWVYFMVQIGLKMFYIPVSCVHPWMTPVGHADTTRWSAAISRDNFM